MGQVPKIGLKRSNSYLHHQSTNALVVDGDIEENFRVGHDFFGTFGEQTREGDCNTRRSEVRGEKRRTAYDKCHGASGR